MIGVPKKARDLVDVPLRPIQGARFQPTGFPDLGAATYERPVKGGGTESMLLVESAQSVANRLESVCVGPEGDLVDVLQGLPYVRVDSDGEVLTSSLAEAHRLNSPYVEKSSFNGKDGGFHEILAGEIGYSPKKPFQFKKLAAALFKYDPNSLVHGCFLESIAGVLRVPRLLSGFIEASNVRRVPYGGVKNDRVMPSPKNAGVTVKAADGYGNVPYHREDFAAEEITAYFNIDLAQLRSYGLGEDAERLLYALSLWKLHRFLDEGLRLRTACDLTVDSDALANHPTGDELEGALPRLITACGASFADPRVTVVQYKG